MASASTNPPTNPATNAKPTFTTTFHGPRLRVLKSLAIGLVDDLKDKTQIFKPESDTGNPEGPKLWTRLTEGTVVDRNEYDGFYAILYMRNCNDKSVPLPEGIKFRRTSPGFQDLRDNIMLRYGTERVKDAQHFLWKFVSHDMEHLGTGVIDVEFQLEIREAQ